MKRIITILLVLVGVAAHSQYNETIRSGRPGQAIGPYTVGKGVFQVQAGAEYYHNTKDESDDKENIINPNAVLRYAISDHFEINTGVGYEFKNEKLVSGSIDSDYLSSLSLGTRINLNDGENGWPAMGIQVSAKFPIDKEKNSPKIDGIAPKAVFIVSQSLTDKLGLTVNFGSDYDFDTFNPTWKYVLNLSYSINDKVGVFVEPYGAFTGAEDHAIKFDAGVSYLVNNDLQLDLLGGYGDNHGMQEYMVGAGISWRILTR